MVLSAPTWSRSWRVWRRRPYEVLAQAGRQAAEAGADHRKSTPDPAEFSAKTDIDGLPKLWCATDLKPAAQPSWLTKDRILRTRRHPPCRRRRDWQEPAVARAHYAVHHRGHPFRHKAGDLTGVSTDHLREVRIVGGLLSDDTRWGKSELATVPAGVPEEGRQGLAHAHRPHRPSGSTCSTRAFQLCGKSREFDSVVVRTPPGISSTVRLISLWRANMSI